MTTKEPKSIEYRKESTETVIDTRERNPKSIEYRKTLRKVTKTKSIENREQKRTV